MLQRLPITLTQVKTCNITKKLVNEIQQISSKRNYEGSIQKYKKINIVVAQNEYFIYEFWKCKMSKPHKILLNLIDKII